MDASEDDTARVESAGTAWHALSAEEALARVESDPGGLPDSEARRRLERWGPNALPITRHRSTLLRFLVQFHNVLIYVLLGAALLSALLDHWVDACVILAVVLVNAVIGFVQEGRAEQALEAIGHMLAPSALVTRDGERRTIPAAQLVPGDVVLLEPGDKVPADLRLLRVKGLQIQEAVLTGESVAVMKTADPVAATADLGVRRSMAFSGTLVAAGQGVGVVIGTGARTEIGRISHLIASVESISTPLLEQLATFARVLTVVVLGLAALILVYGAAVRGEPLVELFTTVVALAVAAIPEGLPTILTIALAIGVSRMARRNAIVRRLPAVETLGSVSVICSDKTGTLTRNEMTVRTVAIMGATFTTSGVGLDPHGEFHLAGEAVGAHDYPQLITLLRAAALCNDSSLRMREGRWSAQGDPMEGALLVAAIKAGVVPDDEHNDFPRTDTIPFDAQHRFMATLHHNHRGSGYIFVKGAPERVLSMCAAQLESEGPAPLGIDLWRRRVDEIADQGQRVIAVALRETGQGCRLLNFDDLRNDLVMVGLVGLIDPPRDEAIEAIAQCHSAGIRVKMITGDHATTARAVARQLHLRNAAEVMTGHAIDGLSDEELQRVAVNVDLFARTTPEHKLRLVHALQAQGAVVAMTGDGVNDAPALKRADIGIAMGKNGTEAAKEAAAMVLADDNFATIAHAVREGRTVYDNLTKAVLFLLPINGGESVGILIALLTGLTLPITPLQILWVNMVSSVVLAMALGFEPAEPDVMQRRPRPKDQPLLTGFLLWRIALVTVLIVSGVFGLFAWAQLHGSTIEEARTYAVNALVMLEIAYVLSVRRSGAYRWSRGSLFGSRAVGIAIAVVVVLQLTFTYAPFMERYFDTRPVDFVHGAEILACAVILFIALEAEKAIRRFMQGRK